MSFSGLPTIFNLDPYLPTSTQEHQLGSGGIDKYGDVYRYGKAGASNITSGKLQLAPAPKTNHHNIAVTTAAAIGATEVTVTLGATAATANEYAGGFIVFSDVAPEGVHYRITAHPAANSAASLTVKLERPLVEAITTSSEVTLVHNTWNAVVEAAVKTRRAAGVPQVDMTAGYFGWLKTRGVSAILADQAITLGAQICASGSVAGAVIENSDVTAPQAEVIVGAASILAGVDTEYRPVRLEID